jgi:NAD(P)-dependent dehydrogenase (short-subunit alcohol dehydrogenase family)
VAEPTDGRPVMLITGAARGIGAAVARAAAPTYDLVVNFVASHDAANDVAAEARAAGAQVLLHRADVGVEAEVMAMFAAADQQFGRLDVLVNNAGIAGGYGRLESVTADALAALWAVNITGAFICAREAVVRMSTEHGGRGGSIINISSKAAVIGGPDEWIHYAASKGAIDTMTAGLSKEVAAEGIRVNSIRPGLIESDFHLHATPGRIERMAPVIPMRRAGTADEVANAVLWLASAEASYVTGAFVDVSGGR